MSLNTFCTRFQESMKHDFLYPPQSKNLYLQLSRSSTHAPPCAIQCHNRPFLSSTRTTVVFFFESDTFRGHLRLKLYMSFESGTLDFFAKTLVICVSFFFTAVTRFLMCMTRSRISRVLPSFAYFSLDLNFS